MDEERDFKTLALTEVNQHILDAARESISDHPEWEFFCECGRRDCYEHVMLSLDSYIRLHDGGGAVLAPKHRLSQIERARRLGEEANALRAQAKHQLKRAQKNLGKS